MLRAFPFAAAFDGFRRLPPAQRMGLAAGLAMLASVAAAWLLWAQAPEYQVVYTNLSDRDGGAVVAALAQMKVPYKVAEGGGAILVPAQSVHEARLKLASQGLPKGSVVGFELLDGQKLGATQFQEQVAYQRALEGELARSIQSLAAVQSARVHLAIPRGTSFLRESRKPSASVVLSLHPGKPLDRAHVAGIVHLVASSVAELAPAAVSVVDQSGALLSAPPAPEGGMLDARQWQQQREIEASLARRIEEIIAPIVGRANVRAQVTAEIDLSVVESTAETWKPNADPASAVIRSQTVSERSTPAALAAQGVAGAASNQPGGPAPGAAQVPAGAQRDASTQYEVDRLVKRERHPTGTLKRLSAAVVVNHAMREGPDGKPVATPLDAAQLAQIQALAREAMGFNAARGDTLNVTNAAFASAPAAAPAETPFWKDGGNVSAARELGKGLLGILVVLAIAFGVLRPLLARLAAAAGAPAVQLVEAPEPRAALAHATDSVQSVRSLARQDPKMVANVVKTWVSGDE